MGQQLALFDYTQLDTNTRTFVQEKAQSIHARLKRTAEDVIAIGSDLIEVKARVGHGQFMDWVQSEFDMSRQTVQNFMNVALRFENKLPKFGNLAISVLYELASPSTPETVIEEVIEGKVPATLSAIREAKQEAISTQTIHAQIESSSLQSFFEEGTPAPLRRQEAQPPLTEEEPIIEEVKPLERSLAPYPRQSSAWKPEETSFERVLNGPAVLSVSHVPTLPTPEPEVQEVRRSGVPPALQSSESNEWYTPVQYVDAARKLMGSIDVDPASTTVANEVVQATAYYDIDTNGLNKPWHGCVWLNPPYGFAEGKSNQEIWTNRLIEQFLSGITKEAVLLVNANTEAKWFQPLYEYLICFTNHRIRFYSTDGASSQPTQGNALVYFGQQQQRFVELFSAFGVVVKKVVA